MCPRIWRYLLERDLQILGHTICEKWFSSFHRLCVQGFGDLFLKDKYILIKTPFVSYPILWKGILEGMLNVKLDMKTTLPPLVFQIKEKKVYPSNK